MSVAVKPSASHATITTRVRKRIALAVCALVLLLMRCHAFDLPLETDEANYAYIGTRLAAGDRLYVDVWDHQPPGVFMLFGTAVWLLGDAPLVFRCLATVFSLASMWLIWAILDRRGPPWIALAAALVFALASSDPGTAGEGCNREIFMATLILAAWWVVLRRDVLQPADAFTAGMLLGLASVLKTIVATHWLALAAWVVVGAWTGRRSSQSAESCPNTGEPVGDTGAAVMHAADARVRSPIEMLFWLAAGPMLLWAAVFAYFAATDRWTEFIDAVFRFNLGYSDNEAAFFVRFKSFFQPERHPFLFDSAKPVWIGGAIALLPLIAAAAIDVQRRFALGVLLLAAAGYVALCLPAQFWPHYYYLMIPAFTLSAGAGAAVIARWPHTGKAPSYCAMAVLVVVAGALAYTQQRDYLSRDGLDITIKRYNTRDYFAQAHGWTVAQVTDPHDTIFVYGNDAGIYYYSGRTCASRYTMATGLRDRYPGAAARQTILMDELRAAPPRLILETGEPPFPGWREFLETGYYPAGADFHDTRGDLIMPVWCRKDAPIPAIDWNWDRSEADK